MEWFALAATVLGLLLVAVAYRLGRSDPRLAPRHALLSPVTQQHLHLFQGGRLSEAAIESAKARWRDVLQRGDTGRADAVIQPGLQFAVQVQALAELGSDAAGPILQRQLQRRLSDDPVEQSWYWIDLAHGLRHLNRADSLPHLLSCPAVTADVPLAQFFAAETVCCPGFVDVLRRPTTALGQSALRLMHSVLRGLRYGVPPQVVGEGKIGAALVKLWRHKPQRAEPRLVRVFVEALRLAQRASHGERALENHPYHADEFRKQIAEIETIADALTDYLADARPELIDDVCAADNATRADYLAALDDLRADAALAVIPRLTDWPPAHRDAAVRLLRHSTAPEVGAWLCSWVDGQVRPVRRARSSLKATAPARPRVPDTVPYAAVLYALRAFPETLTEELFLVALRDVDPTYRAAAAGSLGWWEPLTRNVVRAALGKARDDLNAEVRVAAEAALARLGERRALAWFRQSLVGDSEAIRRVAAEGLTWLWPDLDRLADVDDSETAQHAREALEQLREDVRGGVLAVR